MTTLTVADFADTGQWRLIVEIHLSEMKALLENTLHTDIGAQQLFSVRWEADRDTLLRHIENAVYDNPRVLDDFSARIILFDRHTLFVPTSVVADAEGMEEEIYTSLYPETDPADIMMETDADVTALYAMAPGLKGFLNRTFPGARVVSNLMEGVMRGRRKGRGLRMTVTEREREADFILLDGDSLISASTHSVTCDDDVIYHAYNIMQAYGYEPDAVSVEDDKNRFGSVINNEVSTTSIQ